MNKMMLYLAVAACVFVPGQWCSAGAGVWPADMVQKVQGATVTIYALDKTGKHVAQGSGFFFRSPGRVITNYHVLGRARAARVKTFDGRVFNVEAIIGQDKRDDIVEATVDMPYGSAPYLRAASVVPKLGDPLLVAGSPLGAAEVVSKGEVLAIGEFPPMGECIEHSARAARGSSGGPVVNSQGKVIGIETAGLKGAPGINLAIPVGRFSGLTSCYRELKILQVPKKTKGASGAKSSFLQRRFLF